MDENTRMALDVARLIAEQIDGGATSGVVEQSQIKEAETTRQARDSQWQYLKRLSDEARAEAGD
jgi:hypothetical protein